MTRLLNQVKYKFKDEHTLVTLVLNRYLDEPYHSTSGYFLIFQKNSVDDPLMLHHPACHRRFMSLPAVYLNISVSVLPHIFEKYIAHTSFSCDA